MKKKIICLTTVLLLSQNLAMAESDYYISPQVGFSYQNNKVNFEPINRVGPEITKERFKRSEVYDLTLGKKIYDNTFLELEVVHAPNRKFSKTALIEYINPEEEKFSTKISNTSVFANVAYQFKNYIPMPITPYLLAGIGCSFNKIKDIKAGFSNAPVTILGKNGSSFAYQIGVGFLVPITKNIDANLGYRYRNLGTVKSSNQYVDVVSGQSDFSTPVLKGKLHTSDILLGVAVYF